MRGRHDGIKDVIDWVSRLRIAKEGAVKGAGPHPQSFMAFPPHALNLWPTAISLLGKDKE
jgi:hypothetical protein